MGVIELETFKFEFKWKFVGKFGSGSKTVPCTKLIICQRVKYDTSTKKNKSLCQFETHVHN